MPDYVSAFKRPFSSGKTTLISFAVGFLGSILFGLGPLLLEGLVLESTKRYLRNDRHPAEWHGHDIPAFLFGGLKILFVKIIYFLPGLLFFFLVFGGIIWTVISTGFDTLEVSTAILSGTLYFAIAGLLMFFGWIFSLMGTVNMAEENSLRQAFNLPRLIKKMFSLRFIEALIVCIAYFFVLSFIMLLITIFSLGLLGLVLSAGLFFYVYNMAVLTIMADVFLETH